MFNSDDRRTNRRKVYTDLRRLVRRFDRQRRKQAKFSSQSLDRFCSPQQYDVIVTGVIIVELLILTSKYCLAQ